MALFSYKKTELSLKIALFGITFLFSLGFSLIGIDIHHHGLMFHGAMSFFSEEGILYKDFYFHYGPFTAILQATSLFVFGKKLIALQYLTCIVYSIISVQLFSLNKLFFNTKTSLILVVFWLLMAPYLLWEFHPWSSVYIIPFFIIIFQQLIKPNFKFSYLIIGVCVGMIFFFRQSSGIICFLALLVMFIFELKNKKSIQLLLGLLIVISTAFSYLVYQGNLNSFIYYGFQGQKSMVIQGDGYIGIFMNIFFKLLKIVTNDNWIIFVKDHKVPYLPYFNNLILITFIIISSLKIIRFLFYRRTSRTKFYLVLFALASVSQFYPVPCMRHYYYAFTPIIPLFYYDIKILTGYLRIKKLKIISRSVILIFFLLLLSNILVRLEVGIKRITDSDYKFRKLSKNHVLEGIRINSNDYIFVQEVGNLDGDSKIVLDPLKNPTPYLIPYLIKSKNDFRDKKSYYFISDTIEFPKYTDSTYNMFSNFGCYTPINNRLYYLKSNN